MKPRLKKMWDLAIEEAKKLKKLATTGEIENLNFKTLISSDVNSCIYGQMTGNCENERAIDLIMKCCNKVYNVKDVDDAANGKLNGKPFMTGSYNRVDKYQSPIELLIYDENGGELAQEQIISYLKGETKRITIPKAI